MKIVITGAGEVGTHLAKMLSKENQDIVLIDEDEEKLRSLESNFDLSTLVGSGLLISVLKDAEVKDADLFIAVTPSESQNITSCILAKELGAKKTLARIDNHEYLLPKNKVRFEKFGVDELIYPEMLAAQEVVQSLRVSGVRQVNEFAHGKVIMASIKVRSNAPICGRPLSDIFSEEKRYRLMAITRGLHTFIPSGNDTINPNDLVYFLSSKENLPYVKIQAGKEDYEVKNVFIMGGSRIGVKTAQMSPDNYNIKIIERDKERILKVIDKLDKGLVIYGDGRDVELLKEEGIARVDAFVALTGNSESNILACLAAKHLGVKKTVAEVENFDYLPLAQSLDIGTQINKKLIAASYIYQLTLQVNVSQVKCLWSSNAEVVELVAEAHSKIIKDAVKNLKLPKDVNIGAVVRGGEVIVVNGDTHIQAGDLVIVFCLQESIRKIDKFF